jgi:hypothetical protein
MSLTRSHRQHSITSRSANGANDGPGTLLPRANPAACSQLAKADFASSSQHVREGPAAFIAATVKTIVAQQRRCIWLKFLIGEPMSTRETPIAKHFVRPKHQLRGRDQRGQLLPRIEHARPYCGLGDADYLGNLLDAFRSA